MLNIIRLRLLKYKDEYLVFVMMTVMALVFTYLMGSAQVSDYTPLVLIVDKDNTEYSMKIIDELKTKETFRFEEALYDDTMMKVEEGKVSAAVILESGFEEKIKKSESPNISIMRIKEDRDIYALESLITGIIGKTTGNIRIAELTSNYIAENTNLDKTKIFDKAYNNAIESWKYKTPIVVTRENINVSGTYDNIKHLTLGFALFFSMYTIVLGIGGILNEREDNTWQRLLISPVSKTTILGGHFVTTFMIGVVQVGVLLLGGKYLFNVDLGNSISGIMVIALAFVFAITSLGLLLSGLVKTNAQLSALAPVVLTSTSMLGGCMWPLDIVNSKLFLGIANIIPQKWALEGMEKIAMYGYGFEAAITPTLILIGMGSIFFILGVKLVRFE